MILLGCDVAFPELSDVSVDRGRGEPHGFPRPPLSCSCGGRWADSETSSPPFPYTSHKSHRYHLLLYSESLLWWHRRLTHHVHNVGSRCPYMCFPRLGNPSCTDLLPVALCHSDPRRPRDRRPLLFGSGGDEYCLPESSLQATVVYLFWLWRLWSRRRHCDTAVA